MTEQAQAPNAPEAAATTGEQTQQAEPERTFTQADLKKIAANEKREGKQSAISDLLERTGAESIDDVLSAYEAQKQIEAEMESAADKAQKAREKAEQERDTARELYLNTKREFAARDALRDAGIKPERLNSGMRIGDVSQLEVDKDGNVTGLEEFVERVQEDAAEFFGDSSARPKVNAPQTTGTGVQKPGSTEDADMLHGRFLANLLGNNSP